MNFVYSNLYKHSQYQCKISPNNYYIANAQDNRLVIRRNTAEMTVLQVHETRRPIDYIQWAPNSQHILCVNFEYNRVDIRSMTDSAWQAFISEKAFPFVRVRWSPDSKNIICVAELELRIAMWNLSTSTMKFMNHIKYSEKGTSFPFYGKYLAIIKRHDKGDYISIYHANSYILLQRFELDLVDVENIKWSPNNMYIIAWDNCLYHKASVYRQDGFLVKSYSGYEYGLGIKSVHWSPNSLVIALGNFDDTIHLLSTLSWELIGILTHPTTLSASAETVQEAEVSRPALATLSTSKIDYRYVMRRPFNIPARRPDYNEADPKIGIGSFSFSPDGLYICSKDDKMPTVLWIWQLSTLKCIHMLIFRKPIKQAVWNPSHDHLIAVICNDEHVHFAELTVENEGIEMIPVSVPYNDFSIKQLKWSRKGDALILLDQQVFSLAVVKQ
ncbi:hypothetical protein HMPREF1544_09665 [Mucor circinelloides 1006PhL]|uniref:Anaphase-promoting complex subunit 4 WD40 domain-containing protein n=1 Tax=Mucor circinelloides f. circinelloides (strain 1006PhL) TaxID=1220926 RepID=S2JLX9_MUCC1|nr:hypothetical protein HMPREF1544_09665 [Mucor circinelloides 1006PhL]